MKRKKKNPFDVPDVTYPPVKAGKLEGILVTLFLLCIPLCFIGLGIYQFYTGKISVGVNSRGGTAVSYGGTSIAMGIFILWLYYLDFKKSSKKKDNTPKD